MTSAPLFRSKAFLNVIVQTVFTLNHEARYGVYRIGINTHLCRRTCQGRAWARG